MRHKKEIKKYFLTPTHPEIYLSQREAECVAYFLEGYSNQEVANLLHISVNTVNSHFANMKLKLKCRSKISLIAAVCQTEFIKNISALLAEKIDDEKL